ncbi:MAG: site-2 protease family protein [Caldilineaceae bacterium]
MSEQSLFARFYPFHDLPASEAQTLAEEVRTLVTGDLAIESTQIMRDQRNQGVLVIRGRLLRPSHEVFPHWLAELNRRGYTPMLSLAPGGPEPGDEDQVALHVITGVAAKRPSNYWVNVALFIITFLSTLLVGAIYGGAAPTARDDIEAIAIVLSHPQRLPMGWPFAVALLSILTAHEFGHYFTARYHKVAVTLPYFLPMPLGFGTLGAFIRLKEPVPDRRKLFDIGVAGPLAGLVLAVPLLFYGLSTSLMQVPPPVQGGWLEGNSILYYFAKIIVFGKALPNPITHEDVLMNQVNFAAWIGLLVTALNLLPVGQLDGGHTVFALFGEKARYINLVTVGLMAVFAVAGLDLVQQFAPWLQNIGFEGWFVWLILIFLVIGPFHPPALDDVTRLDRKRRWLGYLVILIFVLIFVPVPMRML